MSIDVFASVFASPETYEQIDRHRMTIGRKEETDPAVPGGSPAGEAGPA